ncbi:MAG: hypothetical protein ACQXXL_00620 [Candidatus Methanosuratincola sp.]|jgi:hypothetical protein|nr:hypothetical protein [Candidatus Methanosuratincola sp.]
MDDEVLELLLVVPVIIAIVAINATVLEIMENQVETLENVNETLGMTPFEYVLDNASGNAYPEVLCGG